VVYALVSSLQLVEISSTACLIIEGTNL